MDTKYVAFDLEIAFLGPEKVLNPDGTEAKTQPDWHEFRPFGITCVGLAWQQGKEIVTEAIHGWEYSPDDDTPAPRMSPRECQHVLTRLQQFVDKGYTIVSWNGLGFDFDVLGEEADDQYTAARMALEHVDMMFQFFCRQGYALGLDKAAKGLGLEGKSKGFGGADAPQMWAEGHFEQVLMYVQQDVRTTLEVALASEKAQGISWTSNAGKLRYVHIPHWMPCMEAIQQIPVPRVDWLPDPWPRTKFYGWAQKAIDTTPKANVSSHQAPRRLRIPQ